ncbi:MAG: hypothetical protein GC179_09280 [Anaerolineaceae bacterium]|nr:hypothetical protein [Anaerolineaceae bacterium]
MDDEYLERILSVDKLVSLPTDEINRVFLHELRMFYSPLEAGIEIVLDLNTKSEAQDRVIELMKNKAKQIEKYVDHIEKYLKARDELKNG